MPSTIDALNRLYVLHSRSLPTYLHDATPWTRNGDGKEQETLTHLVADHRRAADRLGAMILDRDGVIENGHFPMEFTGWNDLSFRFIIRRLIEHQERYIRTVEDCIRELDRDPEAKAVAEELLGEAKGHLDSLNELTGQPA
jgi:hypothetical protein